MCMCIKCQKCFLFKNVICHKYDTIYKRPWNQKVESNTEWQIHVPPFKAEDLTRK